MSRFTPTGTIANCGDHYGILSVKDENVAGTPVYTDVRVDLNTTDGTSQPRILLPDHRWVNLDPADLPAFNAALPAASNFHVANQSKVCEELKGLNYRNAWGRQLFQSHGLLVLSAGLHAANYGILSGIPGFKTESTAVTVLSDLTDLAATASFVGYGSETSPRAVLISSGVLAAEGIVGAGRLISGDGGDFSFWLVDQAFNNGVSQYARYQWGDPGAAISLGALAVGNLTLALTVFKPRPEVSQQEMFPDGTGHSRYGSGGDDPYNEGTRFMNGRALTLGVAANDAVLGSYYLYRHLFVNREEERGRPPIQFAFLPDRGGGNVGGAVANLDLLSVPGIGPALRRLLGDPR